METEPRPSDIVDLVEQTVSGPKTDQTVSRIRAIVDSWDRVWFGPAAEKDAAGERLESQMSELLELEWMPIWGKSAWARPDDTYRSTWRQAFHSTGTFVDLTDKMQERNADLLELLGVRVQPKPRSSSHTSMAALRTGRRWPSVFTRTSTIQSHRGSRSRR